MGNVDDTLINTVEPLVSAGVSVHWLHIKSKRPVGTEWQNADVRSLESLKKSYVKGYNVGLRPGFFSETPSGFLHVIDLDIRDDSQADDAWAAVLKVFPDARSWPFVISGSGGESRHLYFFTERPFFSFTIARSAKSKKVFDEIKQRDVTQSDWEVVVMGTRKQVAIPPSIHPNTGKPYVWGTEIDWDMVAMGLADQVPAELIEKAGGNADSLIETAEDDLDVIFKQQPMDLKDGEVLEILAALPPSWLDDRDLWYRVGMALHHQYEGAQGGFDKWCEWAKHHDKYDAADQLRVWKSIKGKPNPIRMASLILAGNEETLRRELSDLDAIFGAGESADSDDTSSGTTADEDLDAIFGAGESADSREEPAINQIPTIPYDEDWKTYFHLGEKGEIKASAHNVELILHHDPRLMNCFAFNELKHQIVRVKVPTKVKASRSKGAKKPVRQLAGKHWDVSDTENGDQLTDRHRHDMRIMIEAPRSQGGYGLKVTDRDMTSALYHVASIRSFHPIKNYFDRLVWDGKPRIEKMYIDHLGSPDDPYHRDIARLTLLGTVSRVFEPGHKFDYVPILEGAQGKGKSTWVAILARGWSVELEGDFNDKKSMVEKMEGSMICELGELQGFSKQETNVIKGFITCVKDRIRRPYAVTAEDIYRQCIFIGTTNEGEYLRDTTGNRRFWPVTCEIDSIDFALIKAERDQLWAEAVHLYRQMRSKQPVGDLPLFLTTTESKTTALLLQDQRRQETVEDQLGAEVEEWLSKPIDNAPGFDAIDEEGEPTYRDSFCTLQVWREMMGREGTPDSRTSYALSKACRSLPGWRRGGGKRRFEGYGAQVYYVKKS